MEPHVRAFGCARGLHGRDHFIVRDVVKQWLYEQPRLLESAPSSSACSSSSGSAGAQQPSSAGVQQSSGSVGVRVRLAPTSKLKAKATPKSTVAPKSKTRPKSKAAPESKAAAAAPESQAPPGNRSSFVRPDRGRHRRG